MLAQVNGIAPVIVRNDAFDGSWAKAWAFFLSQTPTDVPKNIVLSPGPGHPGKASDFGLCRYAIEEADVPVLGVCLGHQGIAQVYGGTVTYAPYVMHGRTSTIKPVNTAMESLFFGMPMSFDVVRYHSLIVKNPLPSCLQVLATSSEPELIMALRHVSKPQFGVQFHPESVCSEFGYQLLQNFADMTAKVPFSICKLEHSVHPSVSCLPGPSTVSTSYHVHVEPLGQCAAMSEAIFETIYATATHAFWLDSSNGQRYSYMGDTTGPLSHSVTYEALTDSLCITKHNALHVTTNSLLKYLEGEIAKFKVDAMNLPFDFCGGFVGYFGYEVLGCKGENKSKHILEHMKVQSAMGTKVPDAAFIFADRTIVMDHLTKNVYLVALDASKIPSPTTKFWWTSVKAQIYSAKPPSPPTQLKLKAPVTMYPSRSRAQYEADISKVLDYIHEGETYEVCLTNQLLTQLRIADPLCFYKTLRALNPAPFAAYVHFPAFSICSSSPERFLRVTENGDIESKPIKGTRRRAMDSQEDAEIAAELAQCVKDRAENMMVTDLVRNDFGIVCEIGSVHVPKLMEVESYATVHQLVTTVRGRLARNKSVVDAIKATFPGGSMTGAPKKRTMELIRDLEVYPRGVYSGALGYLSLNGAADLNIIIRTAVVTKDIVSIGSGGAIVAMSDTNEEYDEMLLKTKALRYALSEYCGQELHVDVQRGFYNC
ncbi:anthranilate synthase, partial [Thraustotheca clavata]